MRIVKHHELDQAPASSVKTGGMHRVIVEKDRPGSEYVSPIDEMLGSGYEMVGEGKAVGVHSRQVVLEIPQEEFDKRKKASEDAAREMMGTKQVTPGHGAIGSEFESFEKQTGAVSLSQLERLVTKT